MIPMKWIWAWPCASLLSCTRRLADIGRCVHAWSMLLTVSLDIDFSSSAEGYCKQALQTLESACGEESREVLKVVTTNSQTHMPFSFVELRNYYTFCVGG